MAHHRIHHFLRRARAPANVSLRNILPACVGVALGLLVSFGSNVFANKAIDSLPLAELRTFSEIFSRIKQQYVEPIEDRQMIENAIRGMLAGLDPHSDYLTPASYTDLRQNTRGQFGGLGIEVGMEDGFIKVIAPIDDTPAARAGVKAGDLVIRLDDLPVKGLTLSEAVKIMRGEPGTSITLTIVRDQESQPLSIAIVRDVITATRVRGRLLESGYGYVRISQFQDRTAQRLIDAIEHLEDEYGAPLLGLILDLRNNPGGVLSAAVSVSDAFLDGGLIVYTKGRSAASKSEYYAQSSDILNNAPLIVLVSSGSASASEIVAGAIQHHRRGLVMGAKTFGKGSVQTIFPMSQGAALRLTTARYYTPSGRSIQAKGITPDIEIEPLQVTRLEPNRFLIKEADLSRHLSNDDGTTEAAGVDAAADKNDDSEAADDSLVSTDFTLYEALNLLKGLAILDSR